MRCAVTNVLNGCGGSVRQIVPVQLILLHGIFNGISTRCVFTIVFLTADCHANEKQLCDRNCVIFFLINLLTHSEKVR